MTFFKYIFHHLLPSGARLQIHRSDIHGFSLGFARLTLIYLSFFALLMVVCSLRV